MFQSKPDIFPPINIARFHLPILITKAIIVICVVTRVTTHITISRLLIMRSSTGNASKRVPMGTIYKKASDTIHCAHGTQKELVSDEKQVTRGLHKW